MEKIFEKKLKISFQNFVYQKKIIRLRPFNLLIETMKSTGTLMDQLSLSFHEEFLLKLKSTDWEFESRPENLEETTSHSKFVQLDRSVPEKRNSHSDKNNSIKENK